MKTGAEKAPPNAGQMPDPSLFLAGYVAERERMWVRRRRLIGPPYSLTRLCWLGTLHMISSMHNKAHCLGAIHYHLDAWKTKHDDQ